MFLPNNIWFIFHPGSILFIFSCFFFFSFRDCLDICCFNRHLHGFLGGGFPGFLLRFSALFPLLQELHDIYLVSELCFRLHTPCFYPYCPLLRISSCLCIINKPCLVSRLFHVS